MGGLCEAGGRRNGAGDAVIVVVTGGRTQTMGAERERVLEELLEELRPTEFRHGGCRGVDRGAGRVAKRLGIPVHVFEADWKRWGKAAGPMRNAEMVRGADVLLAYPGGRGTANCVQCGLGEGLDVRAMF